MNHNPDDLIAIFNGCFADTLNTRLLRGDDEPIYLPANDQVPYHGIYFAHGFYASGLHEIAHWLIAGPERRLLEDFGYWYVPDGRTQAQQRLFEQVEIKPQATEWILAQAAGFRFRVSVDNLEGDPGDTEQFKDNVHAQVLTYCQKGLPERTQVLRDALSQFYGVDRELTPDSFDRSAI
ncbi:elongation factor P hydroxylase [Neptunomonas sp. XY-337]|uniref:elongation factor P hydroxylase n=1 Tax=Neptunomonas sp. XY-337 TaxID=2561897 RepID=UPI0010AA1D3E|nr:elongation factor P hydroxylase [Neptunomonas sp. XY-337]